MKSQVTRRRFIGTAAAGASAMAMTARSYSRIVGANDRIRLAQIGCGSRGIGAHMKGVQPHAEAQKVEYAAVCDPWRVAREKAAAQAREWFGVEPKQFSSYRDALALKNVDAVMIASCDHQHEAHLEASARAGKHIYIEKPMAKRMDKLVKAVDAVKEAGVVVQVGTQLRSMATFTGCRELVRGATFGNISRIEQHRNTERPYWYGHIREDVKREDVDWDEFLMDLPKTPFDSKRFSAWYGYRETSDGPVPGYGAHFIDLVHYLTGAEFPTSCVCLGGTHTWRDENNFTAPEDVQALWLYPRIEGLAPNGFLVGYSSNLGQGYGSLFRLYGDKGMLDMTLWGSPFYGPDGGPKRDGAIRGKNEVKPVERPDHFLNWLQCMREGRTPHASIDDGFRHAVAVIMAMEAYDAGCRMVYDREKREIRKG